MKDRFIRGGATAVVALGLVLISGCGSSSSRYLAPEYEEGGSSGGTIAILPLSSHLVPDSAGQSEAEMGTQDTHFHREGRKLYYQLFERALQGAAAAQVTSLGQDFDVGSSLRRQMLPMGSSDTLSVLVPDASISVSGQSPDFLLLVDSLQFRSLSKQVRQGAMGSARRRTEIHLIAECRYLLWDNRRARPAAYGRFRGDTLVRSPTSQTHYVNLYESLAGHIIERSPIPVNLSGSGRAAR